MLRFRRIVNIANAYVLSLFYTEEGFSQGEVDHLFSALVLANFTCGLPVYGAVDSDLTVICDRVTRPRISLLFVISRNILLSIILLLIFLRLGISRFDLASLCIVVSLRNDSTCAHKPTYYCLNAVAHISFSLFFFSVDYFSHLIDLIFLS